MNETQPNSEVLAAVEPGGAPSDAPTLAAPGTIAAAIQGIVEDFDVQPV